MLLYLFITGTILWAVFMILILKPKKVKTENSGGGIWIEMDKGFNSMQNSIKYIQNSAGSIKSSSGIVRGNTERYVNSRKFSNN
jgi:hypothetical protein